MTVIPKHVPALVLGAGAIGGQHMYVAFHSESGWHKPDPGGGEYQCFGSAHSFVPHFASRKVMLHAGAAVANTAVPSIWVVAGSAPATAVSAIMQQARGFSLSSLFFGLGCPHHGSGAALGPDD